MTDNLGGMPIFWKGHNSKVYHDLYIVTIPPYVRVRCGIKSTGKIISGDEISGLMLCKRCAKVNHAK